MSRIFQPLLFLLVRCTRNELIRQIEFLKAENQILRQRVPKKRIFLSDDEKTRLIDLGSAIGPSLKHLLTVVSYATNRWWVHNAAGKDPKPMGRPKTKEEIRDACRKRTISVVRFAISRSRQRPFQASFIELFAGHSFCSGRPFSITFLPLARD